MLFGTEFNYLQECSLEKGWGCLFLLWFLTTEGWLLRHFRISLEIAGSTLLGADIMNEPGCTWRLFWAILITFLKLWCSISKSSSHKWSWSTPCPKAILGILPSSTKWCHSSLQNFEGWRLTSTQLWTFCPPRNTTRASYFFPTLFLSPPPPLSIPWLLGQRET